MKYSLAIFDMDGTILNTLDDIADSCNAILSKYGFPVHSIDEIRFMVGNGIPKLVERALPAGTSKEIYDSVYADFVSYYKEHNAAKTRPYDGIVELLRDLKSRGVLLAVNTNKIESAAIDLCNFYFSGLFDFISGNKPGMPPKPAPDGVFEILDLAKINADTNKAVFIGDSDVDLLTGANAGLDCIGVDWGFRGIEFLRTHGAKNLVMKPEELLNFF